MIPSIGSTSYRRMRTSEPVRSVIDTWEISRDASQIEFLVDPGGPNHGLDLDRVDWWIHGQAVFKQ